MKLLNFQKWYFSRSIFVKGILIGIPIWLTIQLAATVYMVNFSKNRNQIENYHRKATVKNFIKNYFEQTALYGDLIYTRGQILEFSKGFGLKELVICSGTRDVIGSFDKDYCSIEKLDSVLVQIQKKRYSLKLIWEKSFGKNESSIWLAAIASIIIGFITIFGIIAFISRLLSNEVKNISLKISKSKTLDSVGDQGFELFPIINSLRMVNEQLKNELQKNIKLETEKRVNQKATSLAKQVAHDIRSPLTAIEVISQSGGNLDAEKTELLKVSSLRIKAIANDLLDLSNSRHIPVTDDQPYKSNGKPLEELNALDISQLVHTVIKTKKLEYSNFDIKIESHNNTVSGLKAKAQIIPLEQIISNMINNSIEAIEGRGLVSVDISDNGISLIIESMTPAGASPQTTSLIYSKKALALTNCPEMD